MKKHNKTLICIFAAALSIIAVAPPAVYAEDTKYTSEWIADENGRIFYYDENSTAVTGEQEIDGETYIFSKNGVQKTGWRTVNGVRKYYDPETGKPVYGWIEYCGKQYYIEKEETGKLSDCVYENENGNMVILGDKGDVLTEEGFAKIDEDIYYIDSEGNLAVGEFKIDDTVYVFDESGKCRTGWVDVGDKKYYYNPESAEPVFGLFSEKGNYYYITKENGMCTGIVSIGGAEYLFSEETGQMQYGWLDINENIRYFYKDATYASGITEIDGSTYLFTKKGVLLKGLQTLDGKTYYAGENGKLVSGIVEDGEDKYYFSDDFTMYTGMIEIENEKYLFSDDGKMAKGITEFEGNKYYFDQTSGKMLKGRLLIDGNKYYFAEDGTMQFGWVDFSSGKCYFGSDGVAVSGITEIDGKKYFFNTETNVMTSGRLLIDGKKYYFAEDGTMQFGWVTLDDGKYYFGNNGEMVTGWNDIDGKKYYFNETSGKLETNKIVGGYNLTEDGSAVPLSAVQNRAKGIIDSIGTSAPVIYNYVYNHNKYSLIESTRSLAQIEEKGWSYFANYSLDNRFVVCYYFAAVSDLLYKQAGYQSRIVYGTGHQTSDHYWNQVYINGTWLNYDACNGYCGVSDAVLQSKNYTVYKYVYPKFY